MKSRKHRVGIAGLVVVTGFAVLVGCGTPAVQPALNPFDATFTAIVVEQTVISIEQTKQALAAPPTLAPPPVQAPQQQAQPTPVQNVQAEVPTQPAPTPEGPDFDSWKDTASILLYEDMVGMPRVRRFVKDTLDKMGMKYDDVGNAQGWLKDRLLYGAAGGKAWDLIILAMEYRGKISGEYFEYLQTWLDQGTSVIIEAWYLDRISEGKVRPILQECGVKVKNYGGGNTLMDLVLWPLLDTSHPVLTEPNNYLSFTKGGFFWPPGDIGDLMDLTGEGDAVLLVGRKAEEPNRNGALAVCMGGQLTLQTFSSHTYPREIMEGAWENYIINALKSRFSGH